MAEKYANIGHVVQVIGPVLDIQFEAGKLPAIFNAVRITSEGYNIPTPLDIIAEVQQHLGEGRVRAVSMEPVEGMVRGMKAYDLGTGIEVPVGRPTLGIIRFTAPLRRWKNSPPRWKCLRRASRLWT